MKDNLYTWWLCRKCYKIYSDRFELKLSICPYCQNPNETTCRIHLKNIKFSEEITEYTFKQKLKNLGLYNYLKLFLSGLWWKIKFRDCYKRADNVIDLFPQLAYRILNSCCEKRNKQIKKIRRAVLYILSILLGWLLGRL